MTEVRSSVNVQWRRALLLPAIMVVGAATNMWGQSVVLPGKNPPPQLKPTLPPVVVPAVIHRTLPPITHPELLRPNPQPHIFVKTLPNRAFRPGEQVSLTVDAFDSKTGAQLTNAPVSIGNVRGVTGTPIPLTVYVSSTQRCGAIGGQQFCLNVLAPPSGQVLVPTSQYPGGGGNFTLSVVLPRLLVGVVGSPVLRPGASTFTVTAVDARTHQPAPGAEVLVNGKPLGPANRPITHPLIAVAPLRAKSRLGLETLPASFGPILIVRAPGYSDEIVHYVLSSN
jgi:hypothetical protein